MPDRIILKAHYGTLLWKLLTDGLSNPVDSRNAENPTKRRRSRSGTHATSCPGLDPGPTPTICNGPCSGRYQPGVSNLLFINDNGIVTFTNLVGRANENNENALADRESEAICHLVIALLLYDLLWHIIWRLLQWAFMVCVRLAARALVLLAANKRGTRYTIS